MGKSWKEKPGKWKNNKDFQKKYQKKHGQKPHPNCGNGNDKQSYSPFEDSPEDHEQFS